MGTLKSPGSSTASTPYTNSDTEKAQKFRSFRQKNANLPPESRKNAESKIKEKTYNLGSVSFGKLGRLVVFHFASYCKTESR